jgi:argininosuccinate lyase
VTGGGQPETGGGRILGQLRPGTLRLVYGDLTAADIRAEMPLTTRVDRAHLAMLASRRLIAPGAAARLLDCIDELCARDFEPLLHRPAPRGLYLMYEGYLIEQLGPETGGILHTGRSRNDLKATVTALLARRRLQELGEQAVRLEAVLLARARAFQSVLMPVYTHFQAAMPVTYGYYLLGVALAVGREVDALRDGARWLRSSPLGAGAVAGSDLEIDPAHTARLLGFATGPVHALDTVASRDGLLRLLATAAGLSVLLSRLATDMQLWSTAEFGFLEFPDRLVGGSSAMPQKRNAFLLEHVKAQPGQAIGAWAAAAAQMAGTPFTNSIEVGTEAVSSVWPGLAAVLRSVRMCQVLVSGARPVPDRMGERARAGFTSATAVANRLVREGVPFRTAHQMVGDAVRQAIENGSAAAARQAGPDRADPLGENLGALISAQVYGGGPGAFGPAFRGAVHGWAGRWQWLAGWRASLAAADAAMAAEIAAVKRAAAGQASAAVPGAAR